MKSNLSQNKQSQKSNSRCIVSLYALDKFVPHIQQPKEGIEKQESKLQKGQQDKMQKLKPK